MEENKEPAVKDSINKVKEGISEIVKSGFGKTKEIGNNINEKVTEAKEISKKERMINSLKTELSLRIFEVAREYPLEKIKVNVEATLREDTDIEVDVAFVEDDENENNKK